MKRIALPLTKDKIRGLKVGDEVLLTGRIYTARDAAHKRIYESIRRRKRLPISLRGNIIYYCGPTPAMPGEAIGSCGPTTSRRMDGFTPLLLAKGLAATIGKGDRSEETESAIKRHRAVYFVAVGGAGAYLSAKVKRARVIAYRGLGPEAIYELYVEDFPVMVAIDSKGRNIFKLLQEGAA
jgi:fumarate hydratase subunit beta